MCGFNLSNELEEGHCRIELEVKLKTCDYLEYNY